MTKAQHRTALLGLFHCICLSVYLIPIVNHTFSTVQQNYKHEINRVAVLDESHIMSESNKDINGEATLETIFTNDYWGRPMDSPSSHKSWRPLTVLSFRWLTTEGNPPAYQLLVHRLFNVITHAACAELVGALAVSLVQGFIPPGSTAYSTLLYVITKALFVLHPTHVEVTANAANRNHLLGVLCAVLLSDPKLPWGLFVAVLVGGYLSSETFLFTLPGILVTLTLLVLSHQLFLKRKEEIEKIGKQKKTDSDQDEEEESENSSTAVTVLVAVLPRAFLLVLSGFTYLGGRFYMDWLNIPEGLIRPAENPFYRLEGWTRFRSYVYVLGIHVAKSWSLDFIGFSHEYGHACILPVTGWDDLRFIATIVAGFQLGVAVLVVFAITLRTRPLIAAIILMQLAWMITFFPLTGIIKVGTFISDRVVVACTVSTCIVFGVLFTSLILPQQQPQHQSASASKSSKTRSSTPSSLGRLPLQSKATALFVFLLLGYQWSVIHRRTMEWMGWIPLLNSSLTTCPRFAKAHLELSKISNGLYQEEFNLTKSRYHVEQAEKFDPEFCDVHQQYAQISIQENKYLEFEERLSKAVTCTFTSNGAADLWQRYWQMTLDPKQNSNPQLVQAAQERYQAYMKEIQKAIDRETKKQEEEERQQAQKKKSPFFWDQ